MQSAPKESRRTSKMAKGILSIMAVGAAVFLGFQAYVYSAKPAIDTREVWGGEEGKVITANNKFALDLYGIVSKSHENENIFFSPFSISTALAMTLLGARGNTEIEMKKAMSMDSEQSRGSLHGTYKFLLRQLLSKDGDKYILRLANRIFLQNGYHIQDLFKGETDKFYSAQSKNLDFVKDSDGARSNINQWVEEQTDNNIKELLQPNLLKPETRFVIVNAIYFKGLWQFKFSEEQTRMQDFYVSESDTTKVDMMYQKANFFNGHHQELASQILELPHAGSNLVMTIILPNDKLGVNTLQEKLTANPEILQTLRQGLNNNSIEVSLPKFSMTCDYDLAQILQDLGMKDLFLEGRADLSGISNNRDLYVGHVVHKAHIEVNEEGSKAAAATAVIGVARMAARSNVFRANHPFIFYISDTKTNAVLFLGRYSNPEGKTNENNKRDDL